MHTLVRLVRRPLQVANDEPKFGTGLEERATTPSVANKEALGRAYPLELRLEERATTPSVANKLGNTQATTPASARPPTGAAPAKHRRWFCGNEE